MNRRGFIATSLIYSFFLVFVAIITALLRNYLADKTILDRFNNSAQEELNSRYYTVTVFSKNANIQQGITLTNLVNNGNFEKGISQWTTYGPATFTTPKWISNFALEKKNSNVSNSYVYQDIYFFKDTVYYYSMEYSHGLSTKEGTLNTYIAETPENDTKSDSVGFLSTTDNQNKSWDKNSGIYRSNSTKMKRLIVGNDNGVYDGTSRFTNLMVINLTSAFGDGREPDNLWIDRNIKYFSGTISYKQESGLEANSSVEIKFNLYNNYTDKEPNCVDKNGTVTPTITYEIDKVNPTRQIATMKIDKINSDIECNVIWKEKGSL